MLLKNDSDKVDFEDTAHLVDGGSQLLHQHHLPLKLTCVLGVDAHLVEHNVYWDWGCSLVVNHCFHHF